MAGVKRARSGPQHGNTDQIKDLLQGKMPLMVLFGTGTREGVFRRSIGKRSMTSSWAASEY